MDSTTITGTALLIIAFVVSIEKAPTMTVPILIIGGLLLFFIFVGGKAVADSAVSAAQAGNNGCGVMWLGLLVVLAVIVFAAILAVGSSGL